MLEQAIPGNLKSNLESLGNEPYVAQFYLAGGTAAALQLGHRVSYDLDFFSAESFSEGVLVENLKAKGKLEIDVLSAQTIVGQLNGSKISFFMYRYPLLSPPSSWLKIKIAALDDLACMKLDAIQSRGRKRDFIDFWAILQAGFSLEKLLEQFQRKYSGVQYSKAHLLRSLTYFADADLDDMPDMLKKIAWDDVKRGIGLEVKKLAVQWIDA